MLFWREELLTMPMETSPRRKGLFFAVLLILVTALFWLNFYHHAEQWPWRHGHAVLAENLLGGDGYVYEAGEAAATYPIWGYPLLAAATAGLTGNPDHIIHLQYLLLLFSLYLLYRNFDLNFKHKAEPVVFALIVVFYAMLISVKWPDAILAFCLLLFALLHNRGKHFWAGLTLVAAYNFRTEALFFLLAYLAFMLVKNKFKMVLPAMLLILLALPWSLFQYYHHQQVILTSTNSGGVLYISLGQLPGNPWGREHNDLEAYRLAGEHGIADPWGIEGNKVLTRQFVEDVSARPGAFIKKLAYNTLSVFRGGLYVTELDTLLFPGEYTAAEELARHYRFNLDLLLQDARQLKPEALLFLGRSALSVFSRVFFALLLLYTLFLPARREVRFDPIMAVITVQILLAMMIQYLPRHISHVIILFLFVLFRTNMQNNAGSSPKYRGSTGTVLLLPSCFFAPAAGDQERKDNQERGQGYSHRIN